MFNQLPATDTLVAMGRAARAAARSDAELGEFERGQLLSAYSASRHLAVELTAYEAPLRAFCDAVGLPAELDVAAAGERTCELLAGAGDAAPVRAALRDLVDAEVALLAEAIEAPR